MSADARIDALVRRWEALRAQGQEPFAEDLCRDCPELIDELKRALGSLQVGGDGHSMARRPGLSVTTASDVSPGPIADVNTEGLYDCLGPPQGPGEIGRLGPYRVARLLGAGGMGVVFQAVDTQLGRSVALKTLRPALAGNDLARKRFLREARAAAALEHEHVVAIYHVGEDRGVPYLAMPLLHGRSLEEHLKSEGRLPVPEVLRIGREIAEGLAAAQERGLVHRDIKPGNIWLEGNRGRVKILDFGLARAAGEADAHLTRTGDVMGTPAYMAPEQASGEAVDHRSDLYSLGAVLYRMGTGRTPFAGKSTASVLAAVIRDDPEPPHRINPELSPPLDALILRLMAKAPSDRFSSAHQVADAIEVIEREQGTAAAPIRSRGPTSSSVVAAPRPGVRHSSRRPPPVVWMALLLLAGLGAAGLALGPQLIRIVTDKGQLVIETSDPDVQVTVKQDGRLVTIIDAKTGQQVDLKAGTYDLDLSGGKAGLKLSAERFTLRRGDKEIVKATLEPTATVDRRAGPAPPPPPSPEGSTPPLTEGGSPGPEGRATSDSRAVAVGSRPLFNGKDLTGWVVMRTLGPAQEQHRTGRGGWEVRDGTLVCSTDEAGWLRSNRPYGDFDLSLEFRLPAGGNSGLYIRCPEQGHLAFEGMEIQIIDDATVGLEPNQVTGSIAQAVGPLKRVARPAGRWNALRVRCEGDWVEVTLNGTSVVSLEMSQHQALRGRPRSGFIGLANWRGQGKGSEFRNIEIRDLSVGAAEVARPLFNGLDRTGWVLDGGDWSAWRVEGGALVMETGPTNRGWLLTERDYADFILRFEFQLAAGANTGVAVRAVPGEKPVEIQLMDDATPTNPNERSYPTGSLWGLASAEPAPVGPPGSWNDMEVVARGRSLRVAVNGRRVLDVDLDRYVDANPSLPGLGRASGRIGIQHWDGSARFRNIRLVESGDPSVARGRAGAEVPWSPFNGRDLTGWVVEGRPGAWEVEGGELVVSGTGFFSSSWLLTERRFTDYRLRFEFQLSPGANGGVAVWAEPGEAFQKTALSDAEAPVHLEVQLLDDARPGLPLDPTGTLYWSMDSGSFLAPEGRADLKPAGDWNEVEIEVRDRVLRVTVNGRQIRSTDLRGLAGNASAFPGLKRSAGRIGFQGHTGRIRYRNVTISE